MGASESHRQGKGVKVSFQADEGQERHLRNGKKARDLSSSSQETPEAVRRSEGPIWEMFLSWV